MWPKTKTIIVSLCCLNVLLLFSTLLLTIRLIESNRKIDFSGLRESVFEIHASSNSSNKNGTCFAIGNDVFVTNAHVFDSNDVKVTIGDREREVSASAELFYLDVKSDIAFLKCLTLPHVEPLKMSTNYTNTGDACYSFGNVGNNGISLYKGIISNTSFAYVYNDYEQKYIESNIKSYQGVSGGPLINKHGECIGMNMFSRYVSDDASKETIEEFGYAIRSEIIIKALDKTK